MGESTKTMLAAQRMYKEKRGERFRGTKIQLAAAISKIVSGEALWFDSKAQAGTYLKRTVPKRYYLPADEREPKKSAARPAPRPPTQIEGADVRSAAFLATYAWRELRMKVLKKYGPRCMCCGATPDDGVKMNVDHIKPRKTHPHLALEFSNLQILCDVCNHGKGNWDSTDWRKKKGAYDDPQLRIENRNAAMFQAFDAYEGDCPNISLKENADGTFEYVEHWEDFLTEEQWAHLRDILH